MEGKELEIAQNKTCVLERPGVSEWRHFTSRQESARSSCQSNKVLAAVHGAEIHHYFCEWIIKGAGRGTERLVLIG